MPYSVALPDGRIAEFPDDVSQDKALEIIKKQFPPEEVGVFGRMGRGLESLLSTQRTAAESVLGNQGYAPGALQRQEEIAKKYPGQDDWDAVSNVYKQKGLAAAVGEYISRVPGAIAEQVPQIIEQSLAARAGAAVAGAPGAAVGLVAPSYTQAYGALLEREAAEQAAQGKPVDPSKLKAAALAVPYTAVDVASTYLPMGKGIIKSLFGEEVAKLLSRGATKEAEMAAAKALTGESRLKTAGKGLAKGVAYEVPGELTQQAMERFQAGLPLLDEDAQSEYLRTAFSTTMLAPIGGLGRFSEKSAARDLLQQEETKRKSQERAAEQKAEEERKAKPDYFVPFVEDYMAREEEFKKLKSELKKPGKDATPADSLAYKEAKQKLDDLGKGLYADATEFKQAKSLYDAQKQEEIKARTAPEDLMMEHLGLKMPEAIKVPTKTEVDEFGRITETPIRKPGMPPLLQYAAGQVEAARGVGQMDAADYADYLMQDPAQAAQLVKNRVKIPGLAKNENSVVLDGLKLRLQEQEKKRAAETKEEFAKREELLKAPVLPEDEQKYQDVIDFAKESRDRGDEDMRHLNEQFVDALTTKAQAVDVGDNIKMTPQAERLRNRVEELLQTADQSDREYRAARAAKERGVAAEAFDRGRTALEQLDTLAKSGGDYVKEVIEARRAQLAAFNKMQDVTEQLRTEQTLGGANKVTAASTEETLANEAARQRSVFITNALKEAALHRRAQGLPALTHDEAIKAASKLYDTFNDWVERAKTLPQQAKYEEQIVEPAQMRANKIVKPAVTKRVEVKPAVKGITQAEIKHFQQRVQAIQRQLLELPERKIQVEKPLLRRQYAASEAEKVAEARGEKATTLGGELRRHSEFTLNNIEKALALRDVPEDIRELLEKASDVIDDGKGSRSLLDAVDTQVARLLRGEDRGEMLVSRRQVVSEKPVVRNVPGKEGSTEFGVRRKYGDIASYEAQENRRAIVDAQGKITGYAPVENLQYQQDIKDALAAAAPTAIEQKEAGQKALFPETETDLGYIRMSPKNFANSPRIRAAWEALDKARALAKAQAAKQAVIDNRTKAGVATIKRLEDAMSVIEGRTEFFNKNAQAFTPEELAKALVPMPEAGNTPEEKALLAQYAKHPAELSQEERIQADRLLREYRSKHQTEYKAKYEQALKMLAQGDQIDALDNQLYSYMVGINKEQRAAAQALKERLSVYKKAIEDIKQTLRGSVAMTPEQQAVLQQQDQVKKARGDYQHAVELAIKKAYGEMDRTLAELLDPEIAATEKAIAEAKTVLEKEKAELEKAQKRVQEILAQPEGRDRMELATYQQFRYEEKKGIIEDLEKQIEEQETYLHDIYEARHDELDGAQAVAMAMADKDVKHELNYLEMMEQQLADMRGEKVEAKSASYPFIARRIEERIKAQKQVVTTAQQRAADIKERVKTDNEKIQDFVQKNKLSGIIRTLTAEERDEINSLNKRLEEIQKRVVDLTLKEKLTKKETETKAELEAEYDAKIKRRTHLMVKSEKLVTDEQKQADKLREQAQKTYDQMNETQRQAEIKRIQIQSVDEEIAELVNELGAYEHLPNDPNTLRELAEDENTRPKQRDAALAKLGVLQNIESLEAQRDNIEQGKPRRKQKPATTETTAAQSARKPLRTGYLKSLEQASEALKSERDFEGDYEAPDLGSLFRTSTKPGAGLKEQNVAKIADKVMEGWERKPQVMVVADESGLPPAIQEQARKQKKIGQVPGVFDPNTEIVYLVASNLKDGNDVALTLAHEVLGHYGLRAMLGKDYSNMMQRIYDGNANVRQQASVKMDKEGLSQDIAVEEVLAEMAEKGDMANDKIRSALRNIYYAIKQWFAQKLGIKNVSDNEVKQLLANTRRFVKKGKGPLGVIQKGDVVFKTAEYANPEMAAVGATADKFIAKDRGVMETIRAAAGGWLGLETMFVDRFAALERAAKYMDSLKGMQMMFFARMYDQRMNFVSQAVERGAPQLVEKTRKDGLKEWVIEAEEGPSIKNAVEILKEANKHVGNAEAVNRIFTMYMSAIRAKEKGFETLHFGEALTEADLKKAYNTVVANKELADIFERARSEYNAYNRNFLGFLVQSGAIAKHVAQRLMSNNDYIPWYRSRDGVAEMVIGNETPIRIGNLKDQPHLQELVGGDKPILDFLVSSVQNTNMLTDMALRNLATKSAANELVDLGMAKYVKPGASGPNVISFKMEGEDRSVIVQDLKDADGKVLVPGDLLVKGMEGIPTQMPEIVRMMSVPARLLRKAITISPVYMAKQLFRDSLAAPILAGANFTPVMGALKEIGSVNKATLEKRGIVGGQQLTGTQEDISKILRDMMSDKTHWVAGLAKLEAMGMEADALTRRAQYNSYLKQGLSEMEATLMSLESMNFNKRGASPSIHWVNSMIPFFNAQIQGLNVLYKAMMGKMPMNDKLKIQERLLQRGAMMAVMSLAYAAAMQDDEAYQNANPDEKYGNWFVRVPGLDEPIRIPVPFEVGYIFKALPEAVYNSVKNEHGDEEAFKAFRQILLQTIPGGTSYGAPQAIKPLVELGLGKSFYTGRDLLSNYEKQLLPEEQYRDKTSELAKIIGKTTGTSPILLEEMVRGYTGGMGLALMQAASIPLKSSSPENAVRRWSDTPVIGGLFQPNDAGGIINNMYERLNEAKKVEQTYEKLIGEGRQADANALLQERGKEFMEAAMADDFTHEMGELTQAERAIKASDMTPQEKRQQLDEIRQIKITLAKTYREAADKTIPLEPLP